MGATGDHGRGGSDSGYADHFAHALSAVRQTFNVLVQCDLNAKTCYQADNEIPIGAELALGKTPAGNQSEDEEIQSQ